jgi:aflatoxin B1 aldehyde reductase
MYNKPKYLEALGEWEKAAKEEGVGRAELGFRWIAWHSALDSTGKSGDGLVVGASRPEQVSTTLDYIRKGPLSDKAVKTIDHMWELVKEEAPIDNFNR